MAEVSDDFWLSPRMRGTGSVSADNLKRKTW
jgi:hypothetical protein